MSARDREIAYLKRTLEAVYLRFQSNLNHAEDRSVKIKTEVESEEIANQMIEAIGHRDEEMASLKRQLESLQRQEHSPQVPEIASSSVKLQRKRLASQSKSIATRSDVASAQSITNTSIPAPPLAPPPPPFTSTSTVQSSTEHNLINSAISKTGNLELSDVSIPPPPPPPPPVPSSAPVPPPPPTPPVLGKLKASHPIQPRMPSGPKMKPFFWTKVTPHAAQETIWAEVPAVSLDLKDLANTFGLNPTAKKGTRTTNTPDSPRKSKRPHSTTLLGATRANNIGKVFLRVRYLKLSDNRLLAIMLSRVRLSPTVIREAILQIDDSRLSLDSLKVLRQHAPTVEERETISNCSEDFSRLSISDRYFKEVRSIQIRYYFA